MWPWVLKGSWGLFAFKQLEVVRHQAVVSPGQTRWCTSTVVRRWFDKLTNRLLPPCHPVSQGSHSSASPLLVPQFHNDFVYYVEVTHQVEAGVLVVQALVGARGIEDIQRTLATHVEPLGKERHDAPNLVPHQKITQHRP